MFSRQTGQGLMHRHRFAQQYEPYRLPQPPQATPAPGSFMLFPLTVLPGILLEQALLQQWIYQQALAQAQAVARPSLPERDLLGVWN